MDGSVHYRRLHHTFLPNGPVSIILTPTGNIFVLVNEAYVDPMLTVELEAMSNGIMESRQRLDSPLPPGTGLRIHRLRDVGGLVAAEVCRSEIDILVDKDLMRGELVAPLALHGNRILRYFT